MTVPASTDESRARVIGALVGLAVGDALGTTLEFHSPGSFTPIGDMVGGGPFSLQPGQWTDDTSMALCLAESIVEQRRFDAIDQLQRYVRWWQDGHLSSTGRCFDIGNQTHTALSEFRRRAKPHNGPTDAHCAGNGSLMRLAPVAMAWWRRPALAVQLAGESSRTTHGATECVDACRYFAGLLVGAMAGESKSALLSPGYAPAPGLWEASPLAPRVAAVADGSFQRKQPPEIRGTGYVVDCLEAAIWAFASTDSPEAALLRAVNLGDDADTTGAVCGQICGAFYGDQAMPARWRQRLALADTITSLAAALADFADGEPAA